MSALATPLRERRIPLYRRVSVQLAVALALLGAGSVGFLTRNDWLPHDERPARQVVAAGIGQAFVINDPFGAPVARITITSGTRQNERAAGGSRPDRDVIKLFVTYEAIGQYYANQFDWHIASARADPNDRYASLSIVGSMTAGTSTSGILTFYGVAQDVEAAVSFKPATDSRPQFTLLVAP
jgi:hypothetical protein